MPTPPIGGKVAPSPSSRVNKESSRFNKNKHGGGREWIPTHPLTSNALNKSVPPSPCSEATRARRHKVKMGDV